MTEIEQLKQRIEVAGGTLVNVRGLADEWILHINGYCRYIRETDFSLWNTYLDGLEVKVKARRCIELIEAEREPRVGILQYENACNHAINVICREFKIEEML